MRVVVTGASGNLGTALLRRLADDGGHDVVGVSRRRPPGEPPYAGVEWHPVDLGRDDAADRLGQVFRGADAVVHLAWLLQPSHDPQQMQRVNRGGTRAVAEAARGAGVGHLVHLSSLGAYSPFDGSKPVTEDWPVGGMRTSPYSRDKVAAEKLLDEFETAFTITRLRPTLVLQNDAASEIARYFLGSVLPLPLLGRRTRQVLPWPKELALQFVHADDVAGAVLVALHSAPGGALNVAADPVVDRDGYRRLVGGVGPSVPLPVLRAAVQLSWRLRLQPTDPGWLDLAVSVPLLDTARLRGLGWEPQHAGTDVLASFLDALQRRAGRAGPLLYRGPG